MNIRDQVEDILATVPRTRDSDIWLLQEVWRKYYPEAIIQSKWGTEAVLLASLMDLPREDTIKRYRAWVQNDDMKYLPTDPQVAKQRRINDEVWRKEMGMGDAHARVEEKVNQENV